MHCSQGKQGLIDAVVGQDYEWPRARHAMRQQTRGKRSDRMPRFTVRDAPPIAGLTALREEQALRRLLRPPLEVIADAPRISAERARRTQDRFPARATLDIHSRTRELEAALNPQAHAAAPYLPMTREHLRRCAACICASPFDPSSSVG